MLPTQPTPASAPYMVTEHPQGAPALGLVGILSGGTVFQGPFITPLPL